MEGEKKRAGESSKINEKKILGDLKKKKEKKKSEHHSPKRVRLDSAEPFPLAAGLPVATGKFGLAQTERGRVGGREGRRGRERKACVTVLQRKQGQRRGKKTEMAWRSGRGSGEAAWGGGGE